MSEFQGDRVESELDHEPVEFGVVEFGSAQCDAAHQVIHDRARLPQNFAGAVLKHFSEDALGVDAPLGIEGANCLQIAACFGRG